MAGRIAARDSATLVRSSRPAAVSRYSGSSTGPKTSSRPIAGTPSRNTDPHQKCSSSAPPTSGPTAAPDMKHTIHTLMATARCRGSRNMLPISAIVEGVIVAPATPSSARAAISIPGPVEYAASTEAAPNAAAPISSRRRRPMRSPRVPIVMSSPASMNPYTSMIHSCWVALAPRSSLSRGSASSSTNTSIETSRAASASTPSPTHSRRPAREPVTRGSAVVAVLVSMERPLLFRETARRPVRAPHAIGSERAGGIRHPLAWERMGNRPRPSPG